MPAINGQGAVKVEQLINETLLEDAIREMDKDITAEHLCPRQQAAILAVAAYKGRQDEIAYNGTLSEAVYHFLGGRLYDDALSSDYKNVVIHTLAALADPAFNKLTEDKLGWYHKRALVDMLVRLADFITTLQANATQSLLVIQDIKGGELQEEILVRIEEEYKERLRVSLSGKHKFS